MLSQMQWPHGITERQIKKLRKTQIFRDLGSFLRKEHMLWYISNLSLCLLLENNYQRLTGMDLALQPFNSL